MSSADVANNDINEEEPRGAEGPAPKTEDAEKKEKEKEDDDPSASFECNICLDVARDAVVSVCGHLFCWPCLHQWLETRPNHKICPVCKAGISKEKVIPLYGKNSDQKDPRKKAVPPRPQGQRPQPEHTGHGHGGAGFFNLGGIGNGGGGGNGAGFQMSFGIGAFPFGFFATNMNMGGGGGDAAAGNGPPPGSAQFEEEQFLQKVFLWVAFAFIFWLLVA